MLTRNVINKPLMAHTTMIYAENIVEINKFLLNCRTIHKSSKRIVGKRWHRKGDKIIIDTIPSLIAWRNTFVTLYAHYAHTISYIDAYTNEDKLILFHIYTYNNFKAQYDICNVADRQGSFSSSRVICEQQRTNKKLNANANNIWRIETVVGLAMCSCSLWWAWLFQIDPKLLRYKALYTHKYTTTISERSERSHTK